MKNTKAREKILEVLKGKTTPVTAEEIYQECFSSSINLSTIYRTLARFHEENLVEKEINSEGKSAYLLKKDEHCHILECIKCHKQVLKYRSIISLFMVFVRLVKIKNLKRNSCFHR